MTTSGTNRREMIVAAAGAGLAALVPSAAAQQSNGHQGSPIPAQSVGEIHEREVARLRDVLGNDAPNTRAGLHKLVEYLRTSHLIDDQEAKLLHDLVESIYSAADLQKLEKELDAMLQTARAKAKDLTIAIVSVALSSVRSAIKEVSDHKRAIFVISSDVSGACLGAAAIAVIGPVFGAVSALSGGIAGSCAAWYQSR